MTDQTTPESAPESVKVEGTQVQPAPPVQPTFTETSAASSPSAVDTKALAKEVAALLRPEFQSMKDKRIAKLEKAVGIDISELEEMGVPIPESVKTEARFRRLEAQAAPVQEVSQGSGTTQDSDRVSQVIKEAGLDASRPEVVRLLSGKYRNIDHFEAEAYKLKASQTNRPSPSPASAPALQSGATSTLSSEQKEEIGGRIVELMKEPSKNAAEIKQLREQMKG